jgi:cytochrome P450
MCMDLFMAGSETTSNTLSCIMLKFLEHPEMQSRVQEEIDAVAGRERLPNCSDKPKYTFPCNEIQINN